MSTKKLYILIQDGGDGSYYPKYTFNKDLIDKLQKAYDQDKMDYESGIGWDGDGFHYDTLTVPADATRESLGIRYILPDDYADSFFEDDEDE